MKKFLRGMGFTPVILFLGLCVVIFLSGCLGDGGEIKRDLVLDPELGEDEVVPEVVPEGFPASPVVMSPDPAPEVVVPPDAPEQTCEMGKHQCGEGKYCSSGICVAKGAAGAVCETGKNYQCVDGLQCVENLCVYFDVSKPLNNPANDVVFFTPCGENNPCKTGLQCVNGLCETSNAGNGEACIVGHGNCINTSYCASSDDSQASGTSGKCAARKEAGSACKTNYECKAGLKCVDGVCVQEDLSDNQVSETQTVQSGEQKKSEKVKDMKVLIGTKNTMGTIGQGGLSIEFCTTVGFGEGNAGSCYKKDVPAIGPDLDGVFTIEGSNLGNLESKIDTSYFATVTICNALSTNLQIFSFKIFNNGDEVPMTPKKATVYADTCTSFSAK